MFPVFGDINNDLVVFQVLSEGELGFVGDYKPDLQVAQVLPGLYFGKGLRTPSDCES